MEMRLTEREQRPGRPGRFPRQRIHPAQWLRAEDRQPHRRRAEVSSLVLVGVRLPWVLAGRPGKGFSMGEEDRGNIRQWENLLPAAVHAGSCEIVELRSFE